ncbi:hypothetical protein [uncultured Aquimarina sp.]|uniref:hypothetical protein n=1 Tax=uncultured Aquimarina sp. TaxID=575652 RepID=UPI002614A2D4|nr:hypothetical protein [uncultured Aquimarina sp.]
MESSPKNIRLYKKALEILILSKSVSKYLSHDLAPLEKNGNENQFIYFTGDIVKDSDSLVPEIIKAENHIFQDDRLKHAIFLESLTNKLYKNCERLERSESNGKDFVRLLRKELKKFKRLQRNWMMSL